jgi:hypothetical protein
MEEFLKILKAGLAGKVKPLVDSALDYGYDKVDQKFNLPKVVDDTVKDTINPAVAEFLENGLEVLIENIFKGKK